MSLLSVRNISDEFSKTELGFGKDAVLLWPIYLSKSNFCINKTFFYQCSPWFNFGPACLNFVFSGALRCHPNKQASPARQRLHSSLQVRPFTRAERFRFYFLVHKLFEESFLEITNARQNRAASFGDIHPNLYPFYGKYVSLNPNLGKILNLDGII